VLVHEPLHAVDQMLGLFGMFEDHGRPSLGIVVVVQASRMTTAERPGAP
jgi:hypothetical protein